MTSLGLLGASRLTLDSVLGCCNISVPSSTYTFHIYDKPTASGDLAIFEGDLTITFELSLYLIVHCSLL